MGSIPFVELRHIRFMIWLQFSREIKSQLVKYDYLKAKSKFIKVWSMTYFYIVNFLETYKKMNDGQHPDIDIIKDVNRDQQNSNKGGD